MFDFRTVKKIHFSGVGGVSLSSLARFCHDQGYLVTGSDRAYSQTMESLLEYGIDVWVGFRPEKLGRPDLAVYSSAVPETDPERIYLGGAGVPMLERYAFLPYVSAFFSSVLAIAGTHGKTTVTSMCAHIMHGARLPFYAHIGGTSLDLGPYHHSGNGYFLTEACEYRRSMLALRPDVGVVLNAEVDHPDTYKDKSDVFDAFDDFLSATGKYRVVNADSEYYRLRQKPFSPVTFGFCKEATFRGVDIKMYENGCFGCQILYNGIPFVQIRLRIPSKCNLENALCACAVCFLIGISPETIREGLNTFSGVKRRFEKCGTCENIPLYTDYAHHPTEIKQAIETAKDLARSVLVVFQPHTYSRTARLKEDFVESLSHADSLIVTKEYAARETPADGCSAIALFRACKNHFKYYADDLLEAAVLVRKALLSKENAPTLILVVGAGDIVTLVDLLKDDLTVSTQY